MIKGTHGYQRVLVNVALSVPLICVCVIVFWLAENALTTTTVFKDAKTDRTEYTAGDVITIDSFVNRYKDCKLEISRIMENLATRREYLVQHVTQVIKADNPVFDRPNTYRFQIPLETVTGDYEVFSRVRYFCNGLDFLWPRYMITPKARVHVTGIV